MIGDAGAAARPAFTDPFDVYVLPLRQQLHLQTGTAGVDDEDGFVFSDASQDSAGSVRHLTSISVSGQRRPEAARLS